MLTIAATPTSSSTTAVISVQRRRELALGVNETCRSHVCSLVSENDSHQRHGPR
jgi:hypothetical protein